jgi:hypothetical protein
MGEMRNVYNILVRKPEGKSPFAKSGRRWEYDIRMGLKERCTQLRSGFNWFKIGTSGGLL